MSELKVVDTDRLLVEYVKLPIGDLTVRVLCRIVEPISLTWHIVNFSILDFIYEAKSIEKLKEECLATWKGKLPDDPALPEKWRKIDKVELVECFIVRKEDKNG